MLRDMELCDLEREVRDRIIKEWAAEQEMIEALQLQMTVRHEIRKGEAA